VGTPVSSKITRLYGNYPNPVNNETKIIFSLKKTEKVTIKVYNLKGALVRTLIDGYINEGAHNILWDGKTDNGIGASSGIYFIRMETPDYRETKKTMLIK
jgi:flagellar hook assembly protein FlgD